MDNGIGLAACLLKVKKALAETTGPVALTH